jgi:hypothetical protein
MKKWVHELNREFSMEEVQIACTYKKGKPLAIALSGVGRRLRGIDNRSNVNNEQHKSN